MNPCEVNWKKGCHLYPHNMHKKEIITAGRKIDNASKALIMIHGRGASAEDILTIAPHLNVNDYALLAPQATNHTWYPYSFLTAPPGNEPWLSSALSLLNDTVNDISDYIERKNIFLLGFSQGACLALEFAARNASGFGGIVAFTGGLIGDRIYKENYTGDFAFTPIFIGSSDPDPHVPVQRVEETADILSKMNAEVTKKIYKNMGHTIIEDEIKIVNDIVFKK
jgi:phospholipase/carboxylesterase